MIGNSYFCDTGVKSAPADHQFYAEFFVGWTRVWTTQLLLRLLTSPWFCKHLPATTDADIEVRLVAAASHEGLEGEHTSTEKMEIIILYNKVCTLKTHDQTHLE